MARVKLAMPKDYIFETEMAIRISDINYGGHLGNDAILSILHEARLRFLAQYGYTEKDIEGSGLIMSDSVIVYKSQAFHSDQVSIKIAVADFSSHGCDIFYLMTNKQTGKEIARAKTGIAFFDYDKQKLVQVPEKVIQLFQL